jgi:hypothetical protein
MLPNNITTSKGDRLVASFIGRRDTLEELDRIVWYLSEYYNAKVLFERNRGETKTNFTKRFNEYRFNDLRDSSNSPIKARLRDSFLKIMFSYQPTITTSQLFLGVNNIKTYYIPNNNI